MRRCDGPDDFAERVTGLRVTALQVDPAWYERRWLQERPRPGSGAAQADLRRLAMPVMNLLHRPGRLARGAK